MHKSGPWDVADEVPWANRDTPRAMVAFYVCSRLASRHAEEWCVFCQVVLNKYRIEI